MCARADSRRSPYILSAREPHQMFLQPLIHTYFNYTQISKNLIESKEMRQRFLEISKIDPSDKRLEKDLTEKVFFGFPIGPIIQAEEKLISGQTRSVAYLSMEFGLAPSIYNTFGTKNPISPLNCMKKHEIFSNMKDMD